MITYTGMLALSRFRYSGVDRTLQLAPQVNAESFRQFFSVASGWGVLSQKISGGKQTLTVSVARGSLDVAEFLVQTQRPIKAAVAICDGVRVKGSQIDTTFGPDKLYSIHLEKPMKAQAAKPIQLEISLA
jgi:hypothetical protein